MRKSLFSSGSRPNMPVSQVLLMIVMIFFLILSLAAVVVLLPRTFVSGWSVCCLGAGVGLLLTIPLTRAWGHICRPAPEWLSLLIGAVWTGVFICGLLFTVNYVGADRGEEIKINAIVEHKYSETRYKTRRVSRRVFARGAPYKVYFVALRLPNGSEKTLEIPYKRWSRLRSDHTMVLHIRRGLLSFPVITD